MEITLSTAQLLSAAGAVIVLNGAFMAILSWFQKLGKPNKKREKRIRRLEKDVIEIKDEIQSIRESDKVTLKALVALLDSSINGDNVEGLQEAKEAVNNYLINSR